MRVKACNSVTTRNSTSEESGLSCFRLAGWGVFCVKFCLEPGEFRSAGHRGLGETAEVGPEAGIVAHFYFRFAALFELLGLLLHSNFGLLAFLRNEPIVHFSPFGF